MICVSLPEPVLKDLALIKVSDWYVVGLQLELDDKDLDDIERDFGDSRRCRREMFKLWLKTSPNPTYAQLAKALMLAEEETLAHRICQKYGEDSSYVELSRERKKLIKLCCHCSLCRYIKGECHARAVMYITGPHGSTQSSVA